jgi:hypothetical protein
MTVQEQRASVRIGTDNPQVDPSASRICRGEYLRTPSGLTERLSRVLSGVGLAHRKRGIPIVGRIKPDQAPTQLNDIGFDSGQR